MELKIKHYDDLTKDELFSIFYARSEVFVVEQKITEEVDMDSNDKSCYHIWFEDEGRVLSYLRVIDSKENYASIGRVASIVKRQGLASKLLQEAITFIKMIYKKSKLNFQLRAMLHHYMKKLVLKWYQKNT